MLWRIMDGKSIPMRDEGYLEEGTSYFKSIEIIIDKKL
jgi:hypothetical protein